MSRGSPLTLFPPKAPESKGRKGYIGFRPTPDLAEYLEALRGRGYQLTEAVIELLRLGRDVEQELGADLVRLRELAQAEGVTVGRVVGRLAKVGLQALEKKSKK